MCGPRERIEYTIVLKVGKVFHRRPPDIFTDVVNAIEQIAGALWMSEISGNADGRFAHMRVRTENELLYIFGNSRMPN